MWVFRSMLWPVFYCHCMWRSLGMYMLDYRLYKLFYTNIKSEAKNPGTGRCEHMVMEQSWNKFFKNTKE